MQKERASSFSSIESPTKLSHSLALFFYKHWNSYLILPNVAFLSLPLYTLVFLSYPSKRWNSGPIFIHIGILPTSFQRLEFLSYPSTANIGILPYFYKHWNAHFILLNTGYLPFSFRTFKLWTCFFKHLNYELTDPNIGILALF